MFSDNIFVQCGGCIFQQTVGKLYVWHADLFLHSYECDFIADIHQKKEHHLTRSFDLSFHYIDDALLLNNPSFWDFMHHIYPQKVEIKVTTDNMKSASYPDLRLINGTGNFLKTIDITDMMTSHSILTIIFLSVGTSLQHLCMEFSYHNS